MKPSADQPVETNSMVGEFLELRLYTVGKSPNSVRARANLEAICRKHLADGCYNLEIVDVLQDPARAVHDKILVTPTLVRVAIPPVTLIGDLKDEETVLYFLGLHRAAQGKGQ
jgi:circadian clock protein KaiB